MKEIAPDVYLLRGFPPAAFNVYVIRVRRAAGCSSTRRRGTPAGASCGSSPGELEAIFITHAHRDHAGSMHAVATATGAPVWARRRDADALEGKAPEPMPEQHRDHIVNRLFAGWWKDHHPVARRLDEGEQIAGFEVIAFPATRPGRSASGASRTAP